MEFKDAFNNVMNSVSLEGSLDCWNKFLYFSSFNFFKLNFSDVSFDLNLFNGSVQRMTNELRAENNNDLIFIPLIISL